MRLDEALGALSAPEVSAVRAALVGFAASSGIRRQAVENLNNETRLRLDAWRDTVRAVADATTNDDLHLRLVLTFRGHQLRADPISTLAPRLGRAITTRRYASMVADRIGISEGEAQRLVTRLLASDADSLNRSRFWTPWRENRTVWATFDPEDPSAAPFEVTLKANGIRGVLGLDPTDRDEPLLLFEYELPTTLQALFPTVAEAYAGDGWQVYFRPAPIDAVSGLTMTWDDYVDRSPRPETVHLGFDGGTFLRPLREVL
jgi:hypothetical protein